MSKIQCLIIEDEPLAAEIIADYVSEIPFLELAGTCHSATQGLSVIKEKNIDVIFLDLHLPGLKGFDFIRTLQQPPQIIVTSAYQEYALEGYELNVIDYLLKPVDFQRFMQAINKIEKPDETRREAKRSKGDLFMLKEGRKQVPVHVEEILYVEGQRDYVLVFTDLKTIKTKSTLTAFQERLADYNFVRIHKSFIVARNAVDSFSRSVVSVNGKELPVGRKYAELVQTAFA
jgi:DNA-binding LytR/AlgR family response regulator